MPPPVEPASLDHDFIERVMALRPLLLTERALQDQTIGSIGLYCDLRGPWPRSTDGRGGIIALVGNIALSP